MQDLAAYAAERVDGRVRDSLRLRGVSDLQIELFQIGHLDQELPEWVPAGFCGWARNKISDVYLFPLTNACGDVKGFQIRAVDRKKAGYSDYLPEKWEACLFGLGQASKHMLDTGSVFLVEGVFDLFPVQLAFAPTIATLTARAGSTLAAVLRRLVDRVWVGYDMDAAGRRGCANFERSYGKDFEVYIVSYPVKAGQKDPGDLWEAWGDERFAAYIQASTRQF